MNTVYKIIFIFGLMLGGLFFYFNQSSRQPASFGQIEQGLKIDDRFTSDELIEFKKSILERLSLIDSEGYWKIQIGDLEHKEFSVCDLYDQIHFIFTARGILVSGEKPSLQFEVSCDSQLVFVLPVSKMLNNEAVEGLRLKTVLFDPTETKEWELSEIDFISSETRAQLEIKSYEILKIKPDLKSVYSHL